MIEGASESGRERGWVGGSLGGNKEGSEGDGR